MEIGGEGGGGEILSLAEEGQREREGGKKNLVHSVPTNTYIQSVLSAGAGPFLIGSLATARVYGFFSLPPRDIFDFAF